MEHLSDRDCQLIIDEKVKFDLQIAVHEDPVYDFVVIKIEVNALVRVSHRCTIDLGRFELLEASRNKMKKGPRVLLQPCR